MKRNRRKKLFSSKLITLLLIALVYVFLKRESACILLEKRAAVLLHSAPLYPCHEIKPVEAVLKGSIMWYVGPNQMQKNLTITVPLCAGEWKSSEVFGIVALRKACRMLIVIIGLV